MSIEIKVLWCKGLTGFNFFQKLSIYASVSIKHEDNRVDLTRQQTQKQKTPVDDEGDGNPEWNHTLTFDLRPLESFGSRFHDLSIVFELRHQGQLFGDKTVGEVRVPLRTLIDSVGGNVTRFVSYEVRSPDGKHNGILDFSYRISTEENNSEIIRPGSNNSSTYVHSTIHISGYNQHDNNSHGHGHYDINHQHGMLQQHHQHYNINHEHGVLHQQQNNHSHVHYGHVQNEHGVIHQHHHQQHHRLDQYNSAGSERIQYPRIDLADYPPPPILYPQPVQHQHYQLPNFPGTLPPAAPPVAYGDPHWGYYRLPPGHNHPNW